MPHYVPADETTSLPPWIREKVDEMKVKYPEARIQVVARPPLSSLEEEEEEEGVQDEAVGEGSVKIRCLDCPGRRYTLGPGESLRDFEVHLKNREHAARVRRRLSVDPNDSEPPMWLQDAFGELNNRYPRMWCAVVPRVGTAPREWRIKCFDCPGKLYRPGPDETLQNFEVHLRNRVHVQAVTDRLNHGG